MTGRFWHGTSSAKLGRIMEEGLLPAPPKRVFDGHRSANWENHSEQSLPGVYLASSAEKAFDYALTSSERSGGVPVLICVAADEKDALPDEDRLLVPRVMSEILSELDLSTDTDGYAVFRRRFAARRDFRQRALSAAVGIAHEWKFRAPPGLRPDYVLLTELML